jgi:hypothetical protein
MASREVPDKLLAILPSAHDDRLVPIVSGESLTVRIDIGEFSGSSAEVSIYAEGGGYQTSVDSIVQRDESACREEAHV